MQPNDIIRSNIQVFENLVNYSVKKNTLYHLDIKLHNIKVIFTSFSGRLERHLGNFNDIKATPVFLMPSKLFNSSNNLMMKNTR